MESQTSQIDWLAFQGASYFRSSGQDEQYGASARGIAVNTALQTAEEFPRFSQFWLAETGPVVDDLCPAGRAQPHRGLQIRLREERAQPGGAW